MVTLPRPALAVPSPRTGLVVFAIMLTAVLVRLPYFWWPVTPDEGGYALGAYWWSRGVTLYSQDLWFDRPQGIFVVYRMGGWLFGDSAVAIRLWGALWFGAGAVSAWALARQLVTNRAALLAGLLTAVVSASPIVEGFTANAEAFMVTTVTLSALCTWQRRYGWAGVLAGVAVLLKPSGGAAIALGLLWLGSTRAAPRDWVLFAVATALPLAAGLAHGWATVGAPVYVDAAILFRLRHPVTLPLTRFFWGVFNTLSVMLPLGVLGAIGLPRLEGKARRFWLFWLLTSVAGVAVGGNWWPHYFAQVVPPLVVSCAALFAHAARSGRRSEIAVWSAALLFIAIPIARFAALGPIEGSEALYEPRALQIEEDIGRHIRANTEPADRIYVAFSEPGVNYFAERLSVVPWLYHQQITEVDGAYEAIMDSARAAVPRYVVIVDERPVHQPAVAELLEAMGDRYELEREYPGGLIYRRR